MDNQNTCPQSTSECCSPTGAQTCHLCPKRVKRYPIPVENKDDSYWVRRKRNNESAKRSREGRRAIELDRKTRVSFLENENVQLRAEVNTLKEEIDKLRQLLYRAALERRDVTIN